MSPVRRIQHHASPGQVNRPHRLGAEADRQLCGVSLCSRQGYLRCLIKLDRLWEQGQTQLACGAHAAYYECVLLDAADGTPTPPGLSVAAYPCAVAATSLQRPPRRNLGLRRSRRSD